MAIGHGGDYSKWMAIFEKSSYQFLELLDHKYPDWPEWNRLQTGNLSSGFLPSDVGLALRWNRTENNVGFRLKNVVGVGKTYKGIVRNSKSQPCTSYLVIGKATESNYRRKRKLKDLERLEHKRDRGTVQWHSVAIVDGKMLDPGHSGEQKLDEITLRRSLRSIRKVYEVSLL